MDLATLLGLVVTFTLVFLAIVLAGDPLIFIDIPSLILVVGGTFSSVLTKFTIPKYFAFLKEGLVGAFFERSDNPREIIALANRLSRIARRNGLLGLEDENIDNPFFKKGIQMCVDGSTPEFIQEVLQKEMMQTLDRKSGAVNLFRAFGDLSPAMGMVGTVIGLVVMLSQLDDPSALGPGMSLALITTFYGLVLAQLVFFPIADKLDMRIEELTNNMSLIIDSVMGIYNGTNPKVLDELLETYLPEYQRGTVNGTEDIE